MDTTGWYFTTGRDPLSGGFCSFPKLKKWLVKNGPSWANTELTFTDLKSYLKVSGDMKRVCQINRQEKSYPYILTNLPKVVALGQFCNLCLLRVNPEIFLWIFLQCSVG